MCAAAAVLPLATGPGEGAVQIAPGLLEEIRDRVLDGYAAAPHGGVELGFVLLGRNTHHGVSIEHFREIPCAHLLSPRFLLSPEEEKYLPEWMEKLAADPQLVDAAPVGWGCSHHRSDLALLDRELAFHYRYFAQDNGIVMMVKPQNMQAVLAGIFLPDRQGALQGQIPALQLRSAMLDSVLGTGGKVPGERVAKAARPTETSESVRRPDTEQKMKVLGQRRKRFRFSGWWIGAAAGVAVLGALLALGFTTGFHLAAAPASTPTLSVGIRPQGNNLAFTWKGNIDHVQSARIEVLDGTATSRFDLTGSFQPAGVFVFPHNTGNVQAVLTVRTKGVDLVRSIGFVDGRVGVEDRNTVASGSESDAAARLDATNRRLAALVSVLQSKRGQHGK